MVNILVKLTESDPMYADKDVEKTKKDNVRLEFKRHMTIVSVIDTNNDDMENHRLGKYTI